VHLPGPELNRIEVDRGRERLSRLGIFKYTDVRYEPEGGSPRDVVYELKEGPRIDVSVLAGYGSYDLAFGGVELNQYNLFGIGHTHRLRAVQSFKSSIGNYAYTIPEFFARDLSVFATAEGLRREEASFDREELILSLGGRKSYPRLGNHLGLRYAYEFLTAKVGTEPVSEDSPTEVAAFIIDAQRERRDNPLLPREGYRLFTSVEVAKRAYGGDANYERVELNASWHRPLGGGRYAHLNLTHGIAIAEDPDRDLPFNKRFFPGGESTVRGYQRGEASPLDQFGEQIGAESVLIWNIELEQALAPNWSLVAFVDGTGITDTIQHYPFDDVLWSTGGGLRWNTVIGPVRLEYGHNLTRRRHDPRGTIHFSIGYPF
jgi:outer membrane protein assembly factor BamA